MLLPASVWSQNLLQGSDQGGLLIAGADRDPDPARDRLSIVMADQDLALAQRRHDLGRRFRWTGEEEVRRRRHQLEIESLQRVRELASVADHLFHERRVMRLVLNRRDGGGDG